MNKFRKEQAIYPKIKSDSNILLLWSNAECFW